MNEPTGFTAPTSLPVFRQGVATLSPLGDRAPGYCAPGSRVTGVTLLEMLLVIVLLATVTVPIWLIFRAGSRQSLQGMLKIDMTQEARRVLQRVRGDLERAVFPTEGWNIDLADKEQLLDIVQPPPVPTYRLLCFFAIPHAGPPRNQTETDLCRKTSRVTYRMIPGAAVHEPGTLVRLEESHPSVSGGASPATLSTRVNSFAIQRDHARVTDPHSKRVVSILLYRVTLQLIDRLPGTAEYPTWPANRSVPFEPSGYILTEFVDTVVPEFVHGKRLQPFGAQNWNSGLQGFSGRLEPPW